jgi:hypothetical protein
MAWTGIAKANKLTDPNLTGINTLAGSQDQRQQRGRARCLASSFRPRRLAPAAGLVRVNGQVVPGWDNWEVDNNTFYEADTFRVCFAASALPAAFSTAWWSQQTEVFLEVFAGFPADPQNFTAADLQLQIYGRADHMEFDPVSREAVVLSGRDLTGYFIDTKTTEEWRNQTASAIATRWRSATGSRRWSPQPARRSAATTRSTTCW